MFLADVLFALLIAFVLVAIFGIGYRREEVGAGLLWFFLLIFLATWAGGLWLTPIGPPLFGVSWLSFLLVGLFFTLLVIALLPPPRRRPETAVAAPERVREEAGAFAALNIFFWIVLVGFLIAIIAGYFV